MGSRGAGRVVWLLAALVSPVLPLFVYFSGNWYSVWHGYSIGVILGIFSYVYFLNTLMLSARLPFLDRRFGHDRVLVFHGCYAVLALLMAAGHLYFKLTDSFSSTLQTSLGGAASAILFGAVVATPLVMTTGRLQKIRLLADFKRYINGRWIGDYTRLKLFHNATALGIVLLALHVHLATSTQESTGRMAMMGIWALLALGVYGYHKFLRPVLLYRESWVLARVDEPVENIVELTLVRPEKPLKGQKAGQFAYLRVLSGACGFEEHPFTISSAPEESSITFTVKKLGDYTSRLAEVPAGARVLVDGPYGLFTPSRTEGPLLLIAGGIGITPFLSILNSWWPEGPEFPVVLVWSCRNPEEMVHRDFIERFAARHPSFTFIPVVTRQQVGRCLPGRVDRPLLEPLIENVLGPAARAYICGPDGLRGACEEILNGLGLQADRIHFERFTF